ncbi:MAG: hypothetical protein MJZ29_01140 [Bacteroidaceae bacterium]|nr:hypothetical protein [Bacteroidaceae bacterium]
MDTIRPVYARNIEQESSSAKDYLILRLEFVLSAVDAPAASLMREDA